MARSATKSGIGKDKKYLAFIASLPCIVCQAKGLRQASRTECGHIGDRGLSQKCPDRQTAPLCGWAHHREGRYSIHKLGKHFWKHHNLDREKLIAELNARYEMNKEAA